ncbi:MAG: KEOPS complex subunit Pcc1, partial [Thermoplasmatota archaeon]
GWPGRLGRGAVRGSRPSSRLAPPGAVRCAAALELELSSGAEARRVAAALEPDNEGFVRTWVSGRRIFARAEAGTIPALLHTLDDYLACFGVAARASLEDSLEEE